MTANGYLCGWYSAEGVGRGDDSIMRAMLQSFPGKIEWRESRDVRFSLAAHNGDVKSEGDVTVVVIGAPFWKNGDAGMRGAGMAVAIARAYQNKGMRFLEEMAGRFVFAIYDKRTDEIVLGMDRIGQQHLFYAQSGDALLFASRADALTRYPGIGARLSHQGVYDYLYYHAVPSPVSIFEGVRKLENSEYLVYRNGRISTHKYWMPQFSESSQCSVEELRDEMLAIIENSVARLCDGGSVGAFLSGGLDSSTVSGMLSRVLGGGANTFSIGFNAKGYDEMEYARIAASHFGTTQHEYYVTPEDVLDKVADVAAFFDEPFGNSSALPAYFCARMAKENGVGKMFAGDGGDEIFAGNERYAKQGIFELYHRFPSVIRHVMVEPLFFHNPIAKHVPVVKKINSYISQAKIPLPDRLETYNYLHRHAADEIFEKEFLREVERDEPLSLMRKTYHEVDEASPLNKMMYLDWKRTLHDNDLVKVNRMCEMAGVEVVYPLLDDRLIEFSCRIPSSIKLKDSNLRWFYKEAVKEFLPDEIIRKTKHGFGLPFGIWTSEHKELRDVAYTSLNSLKKRGIFQEQFIDQTIKMHQSVHAKFYGELVWILMMFELWMDSHKIAR